MSERRTARAAEDAASAAIPKRTAAARRKPTPKGGAKRAAAAGQPSSPPVQAPVERVAGPLAQPTGPRPLAQPTDPHDRGLRRAIFLAELAEARELRKRVAPRRARAAELHARLLRTFRY